jgi:hypothetical protein
MTGDGHRGFRGVPVVEETIARVLYNHDRDPGYSAVMAEIQAMHDAKQQDYGTDTDPWSNVRASEPYGIPAWVHASTLVDHKSKRIQAFVSKDRLENEGVRDSLIDRAVYAIAAVVLFDEGSR